MAVPKHLWWQTGIFYIVYVRSFKDTTGDGVGDLAGLTERLDYLSDTLGVDAIWVAAVYPSPMADFGYDVSDYTDILPLFGDLAIFDEFIAQAHQRGLKVIVDYIPNHCSRTSGHFLLLFALSPCPRGVVDKHILKALSLQASICCMGRPEPGASRVVPTERAGVMGYPGAVSYRAWTTGSRAACRAGTSPPNIVSSGHSASPAALAARRGSQAARDDAPSPASPR